MFYSPHSLAKLLQLITLYTYSTGHQSITQSTTQLLHNTYMPTLCTYRCVCTECYDWGNSCGGLQGTSGLPQQHDLWVALSGDLQCITVRMSTEPMCLVSFLKMQGCTYIANHMWWTVYLWCISNFILAGVFCVAGLLHYENWETPLAKHGWCHCLNQLFDNPESSWLVRKIFFTDGRNQGLGQNVWTIDSNCRTTIAACGVSQFS